MCNLWFKALQHLSILGVYHWRCSDSLLVPRSPFLARYLGLIKKLYSYIFLPSQVIRISLQGVLVVQPDKRGCSCDRQPKSHWKVFTAGQERDSKPPRYTPKDRSAGVQKSDAANVSVRGAELGTGARARQRSLLSSEMWR